jgi:hypothetical protein
LIGIAGAGEQQCRAGRCHNELQRRAD